VWQRRVAEGIRPELPPSFLKESAGIDLADNKQYLVTTRIRKILLDYELDSLSALLNRIQGRGDRNLHQKVIDAMTTNETFWFRDTYPFEYLTSTIFPELEKSARGPLRLWCAACSSGQEPYSISMVLDEYVKSSFGRSLPLEITATDLSSEILEQAKKAIYDKLSIARGMSQQRLKQFFLPKADDMWAVRPEITQRVNFRPLNLKESFVTLGKFDVVFCRNVLIYFSAELKEDILRRIHASLKPGGYLFMGSSESLGRAGELFTMTHCNPGVVYVAK